MTRSSVALLVVLLIGSSPAEAQPASSFDSGKPISIESGQISGVALQGNMVVYRGIPYAAPPVGELRWKPPQPLPGWEGIRKRDKFGSPSVQSSNPNTGSEDCLFLNIWSDAKPKENRPVMVWIHGGGFASGWGHVPAYDGLELARRGVVFVSINYRLGALGFLSHPGLSAESDHKISGNYGLLDQIEALKWIQENIAAFGGDPDNVTVFGESAGATSTYILVASPLAKGLFHKAILQSLWLNGKNFRHLTEDSFVGQSAESENEKRVADFLGDVEDPIAALRKMPASEFAKELGPDLPIVVDGHLLADFPHRLYSDGKLNAVSAIVGTNRDEGTLFAPRKPMKSVEEYEQRINNAYGENGKPILDLFGVDHIRDTRKALIDNVTLGWFSQPSRQFIRSITKHGNNAWLYQFTQRSLGRPYLGASHGAEIRFVFNNIRASRFVGNNEKIAKAMIGYWVQFAETGDPNNDKTEPWPAYTAVEDQHLVIGREIHVESGLHKQSCDVYDQVFQAIRTGDTKAEPEPAAN